jgi:hypothetical protein
MKALLCGFLLVSSALVAAAAGTDITGKWSGSFDINGPDGVRNDTAFLILKQAGSEITGSVGPNEDQQFPIIKGKIDGEKITIEADHEGSTIKLALVLAEGHIKGDASMEMNGENATAKLDVTRVK